MANPKSLFENTSGGIIGVVQIDGRGEEKGIPLWAGEEVWLSPEEQLATANAPRDAENNPFENGNLTLKVKAADAGTNRPLGDDQDIDNPPPPAAPAPEEPDVDDLREEQAPEPEEPPPAEGTPPEPEAPAPEGARAQNEEVAVDPADEKKVEEAPLDTAADRGAGVRPSATPPAELPPEPPLPPTSAD